MKNFGFLIMNEVYITKIFILLILNGCQYVSSLNRSTVYLWDQRWPDFVTIHCNKTEFLLQYLKRPENFTSVPVSQVTFRDFRKKDVDECLISEGIYPHFWDLEINVRNKKVRWSNCTFTRIIDGDEEEYYVAQEGITKQQLETKLDKGCIIALRDYSIPTQIPVKGENTASTSIASYMFWVGVFIVLSSVLYWRLYWRRRRAVSSRTAAGYKNIVSFSRITIANNEDRIPFAKEKSISMV